VTRAQAPVALYLHVPFCVSVCPYCDFVVYAGSASRGQHNRVAAFVDAVAIELDLRADALDARFGLERPALESLYLGGGTPSLLAASDIARLIGIVRRRYGLAVDAEVTIEANPGPDERGDLAALALAGVTRLSIGAQSLDATELRGLGRRHRPSDVVDTVAAGRRAGIGSIGIDLLYDIPDATLAGWAATVDAAIDIEPDHLSLYALALDDPDAEGLTGPTGDHLPTASGARRWRDRARAGQDGDRAAAMYELADRRLGRAGFAWYEISNWARRGHRSRHNLVYWRREPYEAVGPGAHAFDGVTRRWNAAPLDGYLAALTPAPGHSPHLPPGGFEVLDPAVASAEVAILSLRTSDGLGPEVADSAPMAALLPWAIGAGLVDALDGRYALTLRGRLLSNELFARLI
jgi:putative oxygen-independent coproporphyrinogen III oxidase